VKRASKMLIALLATFMLSSLPLNTQVSGSTSIKASLIRSPETVFSRHAAFIFAQVNEAFSSIQLSTTVTLTLERDGTIVFSAFKSVNLPMLPLPWTLNWYYTSIPGLPALTLPGPLGNWKISSRVEYSLLIDGEEVASDSYNVIEGESVRKRPIVYAVVEDAVQDEEVIAETLGLGPKGWVLGANKNLGILITAMDSEGVSEIYFEFCVDGGSWNALTPAPSVLMAPIDELIAGLNELVDAINSWLPPTLPRLRAIGYSMKIFRADVLGQPAGHYVMFRANATDDEGNMASSPSGLYYVTNDESNTRVLVIDPHVKLWLLQQNLQTLLESLNRSIIYQFPGDITGNLTALNKIADAVNKHAVKAFHHWELLGKSFNIYIAWPDKSIANHLKSQAEGGFEPHVIYLSNLWLGFNGSSESLWNWDLKDIEVDDKKALEHIIEYIKEKHAGVVASHGTLSDWVLWTSPEPSGHYKVGSRGHVGESPSDINLVNETTVAALLGLPHLALWEYTRDTVAYALCSDPYTQALGLLVGSIPLQVPYVPFNGSMKLTDEAVSLGWTLPEEFNITIKSVYNELGINAYTQIGWQLAFPKVLAYIAWQEARGARSLVQKLYAKLSSLVENITLKSVPKENVTKMTDESLNWGLAQLYRSIINASIADSAFNTTLGAPSLNETLTFTLDIGREAYERLLQLLPVKIVATSEDYLSAIIAHDKYWDQNGYRAVYFSFEAEAVEGAIAEKLLTQAVNWTLQWSFKNITELLGNLVRVPKEIANSFKTKLDELPGDTIYSNGAMLVEEGETAVTVNASKAGLLHMLIAHPTSDKVNVTVKGEAEVYKAINITDGLTYITLKVYVADSLKLCIKADPESSLNPAYISIKQEEDATPPLIGTPIQDPPKENVQPGQTVTVSVNVTDTQTGVSEVILSYSTDEGNTWQNITMNKISESTYVGQIPGFPAGTSVKYTITAYDYAGNMATQPQEGYHVYTVIPEFPSGLLHLLILIMIVSVSIAFVKRNSGTNYSKPLSF